MHCCKFRPRLPQPPYSTVAAVPYTDQLHAALLLQSRQAALENRIQPPPESLARHYVGCGKLRDKVAIVTGGDNGIGRAAAICFAKEGADVVIAYFNEHADAQVTRDAVTEVGAQCLLVPGDLALQGAPDLLVDKTLDAFGRVDVIVNNAAEQLPQEHLEDITHAQLERTFRSSFFALFDLCRVALPHLRPGASIINTVSASAYRGNDHLLDYSASKGAIVAFTRSLARQLAPRGIRVNAVASGPIDRKSTRLNSSHLGISYAVFCLKKKKK